MAAQFLQSFDTAQSPPHRVSVYFAGHGDTLRADMLRHAKGGGMSQRLRAEITAYQLCMLDDTVAEAPHRDISAAASRAPSSQLPWWASSVRLDQNLQLASSACGRAAILGVWPHWRSAMALPPPSTTKRQWHFFPLRRARRPRGRTRGGLIEGVYRIGRAALGDCQGDFVPILDAFSTDKRKSNKHSVAVSLQQDMMRAWLRMDKVYSLPMVHDSPASASHTAGGVRMAESMATGFAFFLPHGP